MNSIKKPVHCHLLKYEKWSVGLRCVFSVSLCLVSFALFSKSILFPCYIFLYVCRFCFFFHIQCLSLIWFPFSCSLGFSCRSRLSIYFFDFPLHWPRSLSYFVFHIPCISSRSLFLFHFPCVFLSPIFPFLFAFSPFWYFCLRSYSLLSVCYSFPPLCPILSSLLFHGWGCWERF